MVMPYFIRMQRSKEGWMGVSSDQNCSLNGKLVDCSRMICLPGPQNGGREIRMIRRVREGLGFQAQGGVLVINVPVFSGNRAIQKIAVVELHTRLGRVHLQDTPAVRFVNASGSLQTRAPSRQDGILGVAVPDQDLL